MPSRGPGFAFVNVLYYFGGLMAIGAMSLFMTLGFEAMGTWGLLGFSGFAALSTAAELAELHEQVAPQLPSQRRVAFSLERFPLLLIWAQRDQSARFLRSDAMER